MDPLIQASAPVGTFTATTDAVAGSLGLSAALGTIPLLTFFVMLLLVKAKAWQAGLVSLTAAVLVAILAFGMPADLTLLSASQGAVFGFFPIVWIVVMALWFYIWNPAMPGGRCRSS